MKWEDIENNHIRDIADRLSERALALEEAIRPLSAENDWQENLQINGLAYIEAMVLRIHRIADDLEASLDEGRDLYDEEDEEDEET